MHSTVKCQKTLNIALVQSKKMCHSKKSCEKTAAKILFLQLIRPTFYVVSKKVIFTTVKYIHWPKIELEAPSVLSLLPGQWLTTVVQQSQWLSASVNNFTREPCKLGDGKKKSGADRISIAIAIENRGEAALRINCDTLDTFRTKECKERIETAKI